jgi:nucleoside phosphorylase
MPREAYICRVGGLVVALGVGAAIMTGWNSGLAWADEPGGTSGSSTSSAGSETPHAHRATSGGADSSGTTTATRTSTSATTGTTGTKIKDGAVRSAPPGVVVGTGGRTKDDLEPTTTTAQPNETAAPSPTGIAKSSVSKLTTKNQIDPAAARPTMTRAPVPASTVADARYDPTVPAAATHIDATDTVGINLVADSRQPSGAVSPRMASIQSSPVEPPTVSAPAPSLPTVVGVVSRLVSDAVNAILSPFTASRTPGTPADAPSMWALQAFARREFERAFTSPSLTETPVDAQTTSETRTLILSAFPAESDAILARTTLDPNPTVVVDGHHFYLGTLGGKKVIVGMTGIGMVNATQTTEAALDYFTPESGISIDAVVFSGVAGGSGRTEIGSVAVPARWTSDGGETWHAVDPGMLAAANTLNVDLLSTDSIGDPACSCGLFAGPQIDLNREPQLFVGGDGSSDDNNNGTAFPAIPLGGAIFGPQPCAAPDFSLLFTGNFLQAVGPFLAFGLLSNITGLFTDTPPAVDAVDMETAAAQQVADAHGIPFLGIRGMSDGPGDPLNLPGYPFTFFVYSQIAADNSAIVTEALLSSWDGA